MDLSGLIFVALAVAWAVYLIPKALKHHDEVVRSRSVDRFSAHACACSPAASRSAPRTARLVVPTARAAAAVPRSIGHARASRQLADEQTPRDASRPPRGHQRAAADVARPSAPARLVAVVAPAPPPVLAVALGRDPGRAARRLAGGLPADGQAASATWRPVRSSSQVVDASIEETAERARRGRSTTADTDAVAAAEADPGLWDPVPVTLPTYVSKPAARRTVRTIDLDSTGVWTSGRTEADGAGPRGRAADRDKTQARRAPGQPATARSAPDRVV